MALSHVSLEENLRCSICLEIFKDPVVLTCSHSFCRICIERTWNQKEIKECPMCRKKIKHSLINNLVLKETCETFAQKKRRMEAQGVICLLHTDKQHLFCVDDQQLVCLQCVDQDHQNHNFCSISKAAERQRTKLEGKLQVLQAKLETLISKKSTYDGTFSKLKGSMQHVERKIKKEIKSLHQFLSKEEETRIAALREEEEKKSQRMKAKIAEIEQLCSDLSEQINNIKDAMGDEDSSFVNNFKDTEKRARYTVPDPEMDSGVQIDVSKHLGNLRYRVWEKMKDSLYCSPAAPCTAAPTTQQVILPRLIVPQGLHPVLSPQVTSKVPHVPQLPLQVLSTQRKCQDGPVPAIP
ncbi:tripartite motif-containing protein 35-like [Electrophorus electricus]|uniref:tripartite motif-containing protein 35-like n=1 Tax=Electrophorus electricus TaxID=8005 RepID=UPI0015D014E4|nr:tripartite motif-containing protein 35-like [Electrophorus electricus]